LRDQKPNNNNPAAMFGSKAAVRGVYFGGAYIVRYIAPTLYVRY